MLLGEILRNNFDIDRIDVTIKALGLFMRLDYLQAEQDLEKIVDESENTMDMSTLLFEVESKITDHLTFILHEYGYTLSEHYNASLSELYVLVNALEELTSYENPEEVLDLMDGQEDSIELLVELLSLVVKDTITGNLYDYYNVVAEIPDEFWNNLRLVLEGTKEEIVDFDRKTEVTLIPEHKGLVWEWISMSGRLGYNLDAAFALLADSLEEVLGERPKAAEAQTLTLELKTLIHYSSSEDKSEDLVYKLFEQVDGSPDTMMLATSTVPFTELRFEE